MDWKDKHPFSLRRIMTSLKFAIQGLVHALKNEKNFLVHVTVGLIVILSGIIFQLTKVEWLFVIICIFGMLALELVNSAIERTVDLITLEKKPLAKQAKDLAAAAVFIYALMTVIIGLIIFLPKLIYILKN